MKIGIIREEKKPADYRTPFTPLQCADIAELFPNIDLVVEPSATRCFSNEEYIKSGVSLQKDLSDCDVIMGVKEVPIQKIIPNKTYFFFSHTIKQQPYNKPLIQSFIRKKIRMIDYETLTHKDGTRILGFGFFAGLVGAHNGLMTYGKKYDLFQLQAAYQSRNQEQMIRQYRRINLPPLKIVLTGSGRVGAGFLNIMEQWDIENVEPDDFLENDYDYAVYTHLKGWDLYENKASGKYSRQEFHAHPEHYTCKFKPFLAQTDLLLHGIFWDGQIEPMFALEDLKHPGFNLKVIADVTCDIHGSIPSTIEATTIEQPVYGFDKKTLQKVAPYQADDQIIDMMTVDNLPNELPRDASRRFGEHLIKFILPELLKAKSPILDRATICRDGRLGDYYKHLQAYAFD